MEVHLAIKAIEDIESGLTVLRSYVEATMPLAEELKWMPMSTAPQDGRPVWARGWDWGNKDSRRHYSWAYYNNGDWWASGVEGSKLIYLTDWMPVSVPPEVERNDQIFKDKT